MSTASSATRATTPNQPIVARECPGAPGRPERPVGLTVDTSVGTVLVFKDSPRANTPKKARKGSKVYDEEELKPVSTALDFGSV